MSRALLYALPALLAAWTAGIATGWTVTQHRRRTHYWDGRPAHAWQQAHETVALRRLPKPPIPVPIGRLSSVREDDYGFQWIATPTLPDQPRHENERTS